jgi:hypothetical protein
LPRTYLHIGVASAAFWFIMSVIGVVLTIMEPDEGWAANVIPCGFTLISSLLVLCYCRERLYLGERGIAQQGLFQLRTVQIADATRVRWHRYGNIVIRSASRKIVIYLQNYNGEERHEIVTFVHRAFASEIQEDWPRFEKRFYRVLPPEATALVTRRHWDHIFLVSFAVAVGLGLWALLAVGDYPPLLGSLLLIPAWLWFRFRWPAAGLRTLRITGLPEMRAMFKWVGLMSLLFLAAFVIDSSVLGRRLADPPSDFVIGSCIFLMIVLIAGSFVIDRRYNPDRQ